MSVNRKKAILAMILLITIIAIISVITLHSNHIAMFNNGHWLLGVPAKWSITSWPL